MLWMFTPLSINKQTNACWQGTLIYSTKRFRLIVQQPETFLVVHIPLHAFTNGFYQLDHFVCFLKPTLSKCYFILQYLNTSQNNNTNLI